MEPRIDTDSGHLLSVDQDRNAAPINIASAMDPVCQVDRLESI
jgi:hypothetical protein